ncbi:MAG: hypothetical protein NZ949_00620 [Candidatus Kapabacteria bacterium]|nr:hypothetical protein [Candidatus Kapabacteria bacterium]MDW7997577.1 hypothetical protein [Bacteroidota bacterium]
MGIRLLDGYAGCLVLLAVLSLLILEGHVRLRVALGTSFIALQALAVERLARRFRRAALFLWMLTALLVCWIWVGWAREWWGIRTGAALLISCAVGATISVTFVVLWRWWKQRPG